MIRRIEYSNAGARGEAPTRYAEIDWMDDCMWRVFVRADLRVDTVWRKSLTSAQSTARQFIQSGRFSAMSETTPGETPVERRLREMARRERQDSRVLSEIECPDADAIDAVLKAIALLREWSRGDYGFPEEDCRRFTEDARALLARCEETR